MYKYNNKLEKIDLESFYGNYAGKNTNLASAYYPNCHSSPSTNPEFSLYDYTLDSNGLVTQRIEHYTSSYHVPDGVPKTQDIITNYQYIFQ